MSLCLLCTQLVLLGLWSSAHSDNQLNISAHPGQNVTLPCRAPSRFPIRAAEWSRPDLGSRYVFFYRDDQADKTHQHPLFENRVELADSHLRDGDLSLILKIVTLEDIGTYECRVKQETAARGKRAYIKADPVSIIHLTVTKIRRMAENNGNDLHVVGPAGLLLCLLALPVLHQLNIRG